MTMRTRQELYPISTKSSGPKVGKLKENQKKHENSLKFFSIFGGSRTSTTTLPLLWLLGHAGGSGDRDTRETAVVWCAMGTARFWSGGVW